MHYMMHLSIIYTFSIGTLYEMQMKIRKKMENYEMD